jgi:alpha-N-arabinofuranosidase
MNCYAPLFVNVNPGGRQWAVNLIGYDAQTSFGSPSYYVQKMFSTNRGDVVLPATIDPLPKLRLDEIPQAPQPPPTPGRAGGGRAASPPPGPFDGVYVSAMREDSTGDVILKLVNVQATAQPLRIDVKGVTTVKSSATGEVLTGDLTAVNTVADPMKVAPKPIAIRDAAFSFVHELPAHSVSVIRLKTR